MSNKSNQQEQEDIFKRYREFIAKQYNIKNVDHDICRNLSLVRRPLVLFRGKPITREQTMQLITGKEPLFSDNPDTDERGVLKYIFYYSGFSWLSTWLYSDGTIGGNIIDHRKYLELDEFIPEYINLKKYPFLDMVVSYTLCEENSCGYCRCINTGNKDFFKSDRLYCND
ncbi:MAG: hypothetical protein NC548_62105, partial [Lachnospiraceae bacterium]|nr:hypothetical protein [Lachnospiraceae bacterium]